MFVNNHIYKDTGREGQNKQHSYQHEVESAKNDEIKQWYIHSHDIERCMDTYLVSDVHIGTGFYQHFRHCPIFVVSSQVERRRSVLVYTE